MSQGSFEYFSEIQIGAMYTDSLPGSIGQTGITGVATELCISIYGTQQALIEYMDNGNLKKVWISADRLVLGSGS